MARGDRKTSKVVGRRIEELTLPKGAQIGAIVRVVHDAEDITRVVIPHHDTVIEADDHVIVFVAKKRLVRDIEQLFRVSATFF